MNRTLIDYTPETESFESEAFGETGSLALESGETVFNESEELELASEFLELQSEQELDRFLGDLISRAGRAVGTFVSSPTGQALGGILKNAARQALPVVGRAVGGYIGGSRGAQIGGQAANAAGRFFGLELEGLSSEDKEFEIAKSFVRFAGETVRTAITARAAAPPQAVAKAAAAQTAIRYAPGLLRSVPRPISGRWFRRGRHIVVVNS
jgi:hypothetical protein